MAHFTFIAVLASATLLSFSTGVSASCLACPNCVTEGSCLNYWTCSNTTITCYYPSLTDPGTYDGCVFTPSTIIDGYYAEFLQTGGPAVCDGAIIGDNSKCEPNNDPWNAPANGCTASYAYVGESDGT